MEEAALEPELEYTYRVRVVQDPWNYTPSEAATTVANSMTSRSTNQEDVTDDASSVSMYTYTSGDAGQYRKEVDGRVRSWRPFVQPYR